MNDAQWDRWAKKKWSAVKNAARSPNRRRMAYWAEQAWRYGLKQLRAQFSKP